MVLWIVMVVLYFQSCWWPKGFLPGFLKSVSPGGEEFKKYYQKKYGNKLKINMRNGTFMENLEYANKNQKSLFVFMHIKNELSICKSA